MLAERIPEIQLALRDAKIDGWLFACFQNNDPISLELLGLTGDHLVTRRCYYLIPTEGEPRKLVHGLEPTMLDRLPGKTQSYLRWQELNDEFPRLLEGIRRLAAQYSPGNELPTVSRLDAGTADVIRHQGIELVTSADLVQRFAAVWTDEQLAGHRRACSHLHGLAVDAFRLVGDALRKGAAINEYQVQQFLLEGFEKAGLWSESPPIVGVNAHSADPHYQPSSESHSAIEKGDFLLIDLWAKEKPASSVYADITWCGVCAAAPSERQQEIFSIVAGARDAAIDLVQSHFPTEPIRGYEVDDACRKAIDDAAYGEYFFHRTGHSIGISDHGQGANMDNFETHDVRLLLPMTGFSIEPGIYLRGDFGVRSEVNIALTATSAEVTGGNPQRELISILA